MVDPSSTRRHFDVILPAMLTRYGDKGERAVVENPLHAVEMTTTVSRSFCSGRRLTVRHIFTILTMTLALAGCSSGSNTTPTRTSSPAAAASAAATSVDPIAPTSATTTQGSSPASVATIAPGVDPNIAGQVVAAMEAQIAALNDGKIDAAYKFYSKCAMKNFTKDQLGFGHTATGTLTILSLNVISASDRFATMAVETRSQIFVGNQNHFRATANFILEDGGWKLDATRPADCGR